MLLIIVLADVDTMLVFEFVQVMILGMFLFTLCIVYVNIFYLLVLDITFTGLTDKQYSKLYTHT